MHGQQNIKILCCSLLHGTLVILKTEILLNYNKISATAAAQTKCMSMSCR